MSKWREMYKVHPSADEFPMMSDDELAELGADIKKNGQSIPVLFWNGDGKGAVLIDGRNRLEAMERVGILADALHETFFCKDPVTHIISLNLRRRHLTKQEQADLIVKAIKAGEKLDQVEPVSKGGRGKKSKLKEAAVSAGAEHGISEATIKRSMAKAEGRKSKSRWAELELQIIPGGETEPRPATALERHAYIINREWAKHIKCLREMAGQLAEARAAIQGEKDFQKFLTKDCRFSTALAKKITGLLADEFDAVAWSDAFLDDFIDRPEARP